MKDGKQGEKQFIPPFSFLHRRFRRKRSRGYFVEKRERKKRRSERKGRTVDLFGVGVGVGVGIGMHC